jgi:putative SOS response-associated peptidase YedK
MAKRITIIQGHPDPRGQHFGNALADAYGDGARAAGHEVKRLEVAKLDFPPLRSAEDFYQGATPEGILTAQDAIRWANHLLIFYPLWHGHFPALFHAFLEQTFRPGFGVEGRRGWMPKKLLMGKTARIVITMGMPGLFYRWHYRAPNPRVRPINASAERVATAPMFRTAYAKRRCIVPVDGFFEWRAIKGKRANEPYAIAMKDRSPFGLAGIWENWQHPETGDWIRTFAIITTDGNELLAPIHDRMPVILAPKDFDRWLSPLDPDPRDLLKP